MTLGRLLPCQLYNDCIISTYEFRTTSPETLPNFDSHAPANQQPVVCGGGLYLESNSHTVFCLDVREYRQISIRKEAHSKHNSVITIQTYL